jgi:hypothetical protein
MFLKSTLTYKLLTVTVILAVIYDYFFDTSHLDQAQFLNKLDAFEMALEILRIF